MGEVSEMKSENLYPKSSRDNSNKRWLVVYASLSYFSEYKSWKAYYRTKAGAKLAAGWYWVWAYNGQGSVTLYDTWSEND